MKPTVLIVEDDLLFKTHFADAIAHAQDFRLIGHADDLQSGRQLLRKLMPDVLLVDLGLPDGNGLDLIREAARTLPQCEVLVSTVFGDEKHVLASIEAGATGYLLKETRGPELVEQIRVLRKGGSPISPVIARQLLMRMAPEPSTSISMDLLSPREIEVLRLSTKGFNFDEVATLMGLSRHTITTFVKRIYRKLHVHSKTEAIYEARKLGLTLH
ncbi:response regulator transcription factor [Aquabacterium sp.]|uniref:response regulator n=1 Tax=Aquabacterium sp. TaxID=1872578 RepID=UPI0025BE8A79|nr:response regulator transcription factor [Aquabacterium sp.]